MLHYVKDGFKTTASQTFVLLVLWLYHFVCGFLLLMIVKSVVVPLMHRFPGDRLSGEAVQLFLAESQFRLMKTDISHPYLWLLLAFAVGRMLVTPLLNAGVYYSLQHPRLNSGYRFFVGIKRLGGPFFGFYLIQMALTLAPLYALVPIGKDAFAAHGDYSSLLLALLPWAAGYAAYVWLLQLLFMHILLGRAADTGLAGSLTLFLRKLPQIVGTALVLVVLSGLVSAAALSASLLWAGLSALLLQQLLHIANMTFKLWTIASQHHICKHYSM